VLLLFCVLTVVNGARNQLNLEHGPFKRGRGSATGDGFGLALQRYKGYAGTELA
jgi:hypothetical protein